MKRPFFKLLAILAALIPPAVTASAQETVRIGYQKSSALITVAKARGTLEQGLAKLGLKVQWSEFTSGLPLLEALNVGGIDLSADVADTVPIFAQAAGAKLVYFAQEAPSPKAQAILVPASSPVQTVAELKGKKVGVAKGSGSQYLLIASLAKAGLRFTDIEPAYLAPADGRAAFERGSIVAWATWDPFLSAAQTQAGARVLGDGEGVADYQRYYLAGSAFAAKRSDVVALVFKELQEAGVWVKANPKEAAALLAPVWGLDARVVEEANSRRSYVVRAVKPENLKEQQVIADVFTAEGLIPKKVDTTQVEIWRPAS